jgi:hypothetical protein
MTKAAGILNPRETHVRLAVRGSAVDGTDFVTEYLQGKLQSM